MADDKSTDVLMMMVLNGVPVQASCTTEFADDAYDSDDELLDGFIPGGFFEVQDIDLDLTAPSPTKQAAGQSKAGVQLGDVTITRLIDQASMRLMQACINAEGFDSAAIIKRRATGGSLESGEAYMRIDFTGVLITKIDWTDQHIVQEKCTFITRQVQVRYRPQAPSGLLGPVSSATWILPI